MGEQMSHEAIVKWLKQKLLQESERTWHIHRYPFAAQFLLFLRNETGGLAQPPSAPGLVHRRSMSEPAASPAPAAAAAAVLSPHAPFASRRTPRRRSKLKTTLFPENTDSPSRESASADEFRLAAGVDNMWTSPPLKPSSSKLVSTPSPIRPLSPVTPASRRHEQPCLNDYLPAQTYDKRKQRPSGTDRSINKFPELDLSSPTAFPAIGSRTTRRIKPSAAPSTGSIGVFGAPQIASLPNAHFDKHAQPGPSRLDANADRSLLAQERTLLVERLRSSPLEQSTARPRRDPCDVAPDPNNVVNKLKIQQLVEIYVLLLKKNMIASLTAELHFLCSLLVAKQAASDCAEAEEKLASDGETAILSTVHNAAYFASHALYALTPILPDLLDGACARVLGECATVRAFCPPLAKWALDTYGLKMELSRVRASELTETSGQGEVCFNMETDNAENFPDAASFHSFKKQRDMFYEIVSCHESGAGAGAGGSVRARVRALVSCGARTANLRHLAALVVSHALQPRAPDRLTKLQRRLTAPTEGGRWWWSPAESFHREVCAVSEHAGFRAHLADALATELLALDDAPLPTADAGREFGPRSRKLCLLGHLLGTLAAGPYTDSDAAALPLRQYFQPSIDLIGRLQSASREGRLCVTVPWIVQYLAAFDAITLRVQYMRRVIIMLRHIQANSTPPTCHARTALFISVALGWLFAQPHFPHDLLYSLQVMYPMSAEPARTEPGLDQTDVVAESGLCELWVGARELGALLDSGAAAGRHVTPLTLSGLSKKTHIQARLQEELLRTQSASTRRVIDVVTERISAHMQRELTGWLRASADAARAQAKELVHSSPANRRDQQSLLPALQAVYTKSLSTLVEEAPRRAERVAGERAGAALCALLPASSPRLLHLFRAIVVRAVNTRVRRWLLDNCTSTGILCKNIETQLQELLSHQDNGVADVQTASAIAPKQVTFASVAEAVKRVKEIVRVVLERSVAPAPAQYAECLRAAALAAARSNETARPPSCRLLLQLSVDLCVVCVCRNPKDVTDEFLRLVEAVWHACCPSRPDTSPKADPGDPFPRDFGNEARAPTPHSDDEEVTYNVKADKHSVQGTTSVVTTDATSPRSVAAVLVPNTPVRDTPVRNTPVRDTPVRDTPVRDTPVRDTPVRDTPVRDTPVPDTPVPDTPRPADCNLDLFQRLLCPRNIELLNSIDQKALKACEEALTRMFRLALSHGYVDLDSLTEQCIAIYRDDTSKGDGARLAVRAARKALPTAPFLSFLVEFD